MFYFLILSTPFIFTFINEELFEFNKMLFVYANTVLILAFWGIKMIRAKKIIFKRSFFDLPLLIFIFSQLISTIFSIHLPTSVFGIYSRLQGGLLSTLSYAALYWALVSNLNKKQLPKLFLTFSLAVFLAATYALPEHFGASFSCLFYGQNFDTSCWVQDVQTRVFGSFGQPNWLAAFLVTLLPLQAAQLLTLKNKTNFKYFYLFNLFIITSVLLFTKSRSGFLSFLVAGLLFFAGLFVINKKYFFQKKIGEIMLALIIPILIFGSSYSPGLINLFAEKSLPETNNTQELNITDSGQIRKIVWQGAFKLWQQYPLFGSGVETFAYSYYLTRPLSHNLTSEWDFIYNKAHNEYLNFLANTGLFGLLSYLLINLSPIFLISLIIFKNKYNLKKSQKILALAIASGLISLSISNFFGFSTVNAGLLFFLLPACLTLIISKDKPQKIKFTRLNFKQIFLIIILISLSLYGELMIAKTWLADYLFAKAKTYFAQNQIEPGLQNLQTALALTPNQSLYYDYLGLQTAKIALAYEDTDFATQAILANQIALQLNPVNITFYKNQLKILLSLSIFNPQLLETAQQQAQVAINLAPTDAKLYYYLAQIQLAANKTSEAKSTLEKTLELKNNYSEAQELLDSIIKT